MTPDVYADVDEMFCEQRHDNKWNCDLYGSMGDTIQRDIVVDSAQFDGHGTSTATEGGVMHISDMGASCRRRTDTGVPRNNSYLTCKG